MFPTLLLGLCLAVPLAGSGPAGRPVGDTSFLQYAIDGGAITFYLSARPTGRVLPPILAIQGTDCGSPFVREGERIFGGLQSLVLETAQGRSLVMHQRGAPSFRSQS